MLHYSEISPRPPYEADSLVLEVTTGCSQAKPCKFCGFYGKAFSIRPMDELAAELDEVENVWLTSPKRAFLLSGNALGMPPGKMFEVLETIRSKVSSIETIGSFMRFADIKNLSDEQLARMAGLGVDNLSLGAESGCDEILEFLGKQHCAADIVEQCARLDAAGISYTLWHMVGAAGYGKGPENGRRSAEVYSQTHPKCVYITTFGIFPNTEMQKIYDAGEYEMSSVDENIRELRELYAGLTCKTLFDCMHEHNDVLIRSNLGNPEEDAKVLAFLDEIIETEQMSKEPRPVVTPEIVGGHYVD